MVTERLPVQSPLTTPRGRATKARIIEAAAELVALRGVAGTSLDDIMAASGTSKSQLYHYFASRDALMCAVIEAQARRVLGLQESCLSQVRSIDDLKSWRDQLVQATRASGGIGGCPIGSLASELADRSEEARAYLVRGFRQWESCLAAGFRTMQQAGTLDPATNPEDLATSVISALQGGLLLAQTTRSVRPLELALDMALAHVESQSSKRR